MNNPNGGIPQVAIKPDGGTFDASDWNPPSGDISLDELFPNPELTPQVSQQVIQPVPQAPVQDEFFLKSETGTVYKTREEAARGTAEKDRLIDRQKQELAQFKAQQPVSSGQPVSQPDIAEDLFKRLSEAAQKGDAHAYAQALADFQMAVLAPYAPLLTDVAKEKGIRANESEAQDLRGFVGSSEMQETLERFPSLKQAIQSAENDPRMAHQLGEFYRLAYDSHISRKAVAANRALSNTVPVQTTPIPSRPTLSPSTPTPVPSTSSVPTTPRTREEILRNHEARKEFIKRFKEERAGVLDQSWEQIGL